MGGPTKRPRLGGFKQQTSAVSHSSFPLCPDFSVQTPVFRSAAHPNPARPHLNMITFVNTLFPNKPTLMGSGGEQILRSLGVRKKVSVWLWSDSPPRVSLEQRWGRWMNMGMTPPNCRPSGGPLVCLSRTFSFSLSGFCGKAVVSMDSEGNENPSFIHPEWIYRIPTGHQSLGVGM